MTIQDVADSLGVSKKKVWKAVKDGHLKAEKKMRGKAWRYAVTEEAAEAYRLFLEDDNEWETADETAETQRNETRNDFEETQGNGNETGGNGLETVRELFDRLEMSHRKQIYLELQLKQSQRLLCEVNEDQHAKEARAREAEAKIELAQNQAKAAILQAEAAKKEAAESKFELESLKVEMATRKEQWSEQRKPWYKKLFTRSS